MNHRRPRIYKKKNFNLIIISQRIGIFVISFDDLQRVIAGNVLLKMRFDSQTKREKDLNRRFEESERLRHQQDREIERLKQVVQQTHAVTQPIMQQQKPTTLDWSSCCL